MISTLHLPLLAIDTSTNYLSLALVVNGTTYLRHSDAGTAQSEQILPQIAEILAEASISTADLGRIIYASGPGAFTGLRIGIGVAQGLAAPFNIPLQGIPTLDCVASKKFPAQCVLAAIDARMGEVFYAWFDTSNQRRLSDYHVGKAADIQPPANCLNPIGVGNAFALNTTPPFSGSADMPTAMDYLKLAAQSDYPITTAANAQLLYVRNKIALTAREQAMQKAST